MNKVIQSIARKYFDENVSDIKRIPKGFKNESYLITLESKERYVVKAYATDFLSDEIIENYCHIIDKLYKQGLPVLEQIVSKNGRYLTNVELNGEKRQVTISRYVNSANLGEAYLDKKTIENISTTLKNLHKQLLGFNLNSEVRELNPIKTLEGMIEAEAVEEIKDYFKDNLYRPKRLGKYIDEYLETGTWLLNYFKKNEELIKSNRQLIHGDFNLTNLNIIDSKIQTIFDFDEMTFAPKTFEIACSIVHLDEGFMFTDELFEVFLKEYFENENLEELVKEVYMFMQYRCFYRVSRYFTYYRKSKNKVEHFTKYQEKIDKYKRMETELLAI